jgi:NitT/TauT family transport system substrate-binding protein
MLNPPVRARRVRVRLTALALGLCAAIAGCTSAGDADGAVAPSRALVEQAALRVGVLPIVDAAPLQRAQSAGYFADEGLTVELVPVQGGAVAVPQLVSGELDLTFSNWPSLLLAQANGEGDFRFVSAGYNAAPNTFLVMTAPGSSVRRPEDLAGKRIAINTFKGIVELISRSALQTIGVDANAVQFVSMPFPDMLPALERNEIDAAVMVEPFITQAATEFGAISVLDAASGPTDGIPLAGVATTAEFVQQKPHTVAAVQRALDRAQADLSDRSVVEQTLPTYSSITTETAVLLNLGTWPTTLDATRLQRVADLMREFGVLTAPLDVRPLIQPPPVPAEPLR